MALRWEWNFSSSAELLSLSAQTELVGFCNKRGLPTCCVQLWHNTLNIKVPCHCCLFLETVWFVVLNVLLQGGGNIFLCVLFPFDIWFTFFKGQINLFCQKDKVFCTAGITGTSKQEPRSLVKKSLSHFCSWAKTLQSELVSWLYPKKKLGTYKPPLTESVFLWFWCLKHLFSNT